MCTGRPAETGMPKIKTAPRSRAVSLRKAAAKRQHSSPAAAALPEAGRLERLAAAVEAVRTGRRASPRTSKLVASGVPKMSQKVIEEAAEVAIEAIRGDRQAVIAEAVDLFYNLVVLLSSSGVSLGDVWAEMDRREALLGMAEKLPKVLGDSD